MQPHLLYFLTRTPLHVGAGSSVGAIDQPIVRERHTQFPIIPASSLKGTFADAWADELRPNKRAELVRILKRSAGDSEDYLAPNLVWLFGSDDANASAAGALQFSEARLLAFPVRSAKGSFAWLTSPLALARAARDCVPRVKALDKPTLKRLTDETAFFIKSVKEAAEKESPGALALGDKVVLEEYTFAHSGDPLNDLGNALAGLVPDDPVWSQVAQRLAIVSDGMLSFFAKNACEVAQHVSIDDATGTAAEGKLFNQENVPSETLFYSVLTCFDGRGEFAAGKPAAKTCGQAATAFRDKIGEAGIGVFQFGGDASTGHGYCTVCLAELVRPSATNANAA